MQNPEVNEEENLTEEPEMIKTYNHLIHLDNEGKLRKCIPSAKYPTATFLVKYIKSLVGSDMSNV